MERICLKSQNIFDLDYKILTEQFNAHLQSYQNALLELNPRELYAPENYILSLGGKRLRPLLALIACDLFDEDPAKALDAALCVELFHNFSLIHDDILDEAPLRRNHPTVHHKWNTNIAILSGDVMLVKAFAVLNSYDAFQFHKMTSLFTRTAVEVCEGQQLDMNFEKQENVTVDDYLKMITYKTAVLLGCSLQLGAIAANAGAVQQKHLHDFGTHLGIAFQLLDDLLDVYADEKNFGKQVAGDILSNKKTFLYLKAYELANSEQQRKLNNYFSLNKSSADEKISGVRSVYDELNIQQECISRANEHTQKALHHLDQVEGNILKIESLKNFASALLNRNT